MVVLISSPPAPADAQLLTQKLAVIGLRLVGDTREKQSLEDLT